MQHFRLIVIMIGLKYSSLALAAPCTPQDSRGRPVVLQHDPLFETLISAEQCPLRAADLRSVLTAKGMTLSPLMVANRGFHNPMAGSFSVFETVRGTSAGHEFGDQHFMFGHFVGAQGRNLVLADDGGLLVEALAWDFTKKAYNFYELIGSNDGRRVWFYRGDSHDIADDIKHLHLSSAGFGTKLRCSGCHMSGGPIMKELRPPHNDWWTTSTKLPLGGRTPNDELAAIMAELKDPGHLADAVQKGAEDLYATTAEHTESMRLRLRPLFCSVEVNLASSTQRLNAIPASVTIPTGFFVDPWWQITNKVRVNADDYYAALTAKVSSFPENGLLDADHAWLTPERSWADTTLVNQLVAGGVVTSEFVADVLAIDMTHPLFSKERCALLAFVPEDESDWQTQLVDALADAQNAAAQQLHRHLTDSQFDEAFHRAAAEDFVASCQDQSNLNRLLDLLKQRRQAVYDNVISTHPRGQILEPGFRVIFPTWNGPAEQLTLNRSCVVQ